MEEEEEEEEVSLSPPRPTIFCQVNMEMFLLQGKSGAMKPGTGFSSFTVIHGCVFGNEWPKNIKRSSFCFRF